MAYGRAASISNTDLNKISSWLVGGLTDTEKHLISLYFKNQKTKTKELNGLYEGMLQITVNQLREIGSYVINQTDIDSVKAYKNSSDIPQSYRLYTNATENLTMAIIHDILSKPDREHALIAMERWVIICNKCYLQNDFFSTFAIASALSTNPILRSQLYLNLSPTSHSLFKKFESLMLRSEWLAKIQENCLHRNENFIPSLCNLANSLDKVEEKITDELKQKSEKKRLRLSFSSTKFKLKPLRNKELESTLDLLFKKSNEDFYNYYADLAKQLVTGKRKKKFKLRKLMLRIRTYTAHDSIALLHGKLKTYILKSPNDSQYDLIYKLEKILEDERMCEEQIIIELSKELRGYSGKLDKDIVELFKKINDCLIDIINTRPSKLILIKTAETSPVKNNSPLKEKTFEKEIIEIESADKSITEISISSESKEKLSSSHSSEKVKPPIVPEIQTDLPIEASLPVISTLVIQPISISPSNTNSSHREELDQLGTARVVSQNKELFETLIKKYKDEKSATPQIRALVSPRYISKNEIEGLTQVGIFSKAQSLPENMSHQITGRPHTAREKKQT